MTLSTVPSHNVSHGPSTSLAVREDTVLTEQQRDALANTGLDHFAHHARFSTDRTQLFFVKVFRGDIFLGLAPIIKTVNYKNTNLLKANVRRWAGPLLGLLSRKTTYMVDTAFMGFQYTSPFFAVTPNNASTVRNSVFDHLCAKQDVDHVWISTPTENLDWAKQRGLESFNALPAVAVNVAKHTSLESYLENLTKKRRKNFRQDRKPFDEHGGVIDYFTPPLPVDLATELQQLLVKSATYNHSHHDLAVPFEDLQIHREAFISQQQHVLVAKIKGRAVGFFSFFSNGDVMHQCHGGLDYDLSFKTKTYHNLMNAAIHFAIEQGFSRVTFGPLNNETKRRIGSEFLPVTAHLWSREKLAGIVSKLLFIPNFQIYRGPAVSEQ